VGEQGFHNATGYPIFDDVEFPDPKAMTNKAKSLGIEPGWYGNNCHCGDHSTHCKEDDSCYAGDVQALVDYGFTSLKVDSCGIQKNITLFAELLNRSGHHVLLENCHLSPKADPDPKDPSKMLCPGNFFRSSADIRPTYGSIIGNLLSVAQYNDQGRTGPGCWAYPDMLEVRSASFLFYKM
jgi:hypothetical protein